MHLATPPRQGAPAPARALRAAALAIAFALAAAPGAHARSRHTAPRVERRLAIASPAAPTVSGRVRVTAHGFGRGVRRVEFTIDGRAFATTRTRPYGEGGWLNTRSLRNGNHTLRVKAWYARRTQMTHERMTVDNVRRTRRHPKHASAASTPVAHSQPVTPPPANTAALTDAWGAAGTGGQFVPLSDADAAAAVLTTPETRNDNAGPNGYVPTAAQLQTFRGALDPWGRTTVQANPYYAYVTGDYTGTTDEIIQWAAAKWGIPVDWLRAQYMQESNWCQNMLGDLTTVSPALYAEYPPQARVPNTYEVYESMGISQVKWIPDGSVGAGTEPLRWESTAFNVDYQAANVRFYYDNPNRIRSSWGDSTYVAGQPWNSIGGWFNPWPWGNAAQLQYVQHVQSQLINRTWTQPIPRTASCA